MVVVEGTVINRVMFKCSIGSDSSSWELCMLHSGSNHAQTRHDFRNEKSRPIFDLGFEYEASSFRVDQGVS